LRRQAALRCHIDHQQHLPAKRRQGVGLTIDTCNRNTVNFIVHLHLRRRCYKIERTSSLHRKEAQMRFPTVLALAAATLVTGCALTQGEPPSLEGTRWQLVSVSGRDLPVPEQKPVALGFHDSRVYFHACNAL